MTGLIGGSPPVYENVGNNPWPEEIAKTVGVHLAVIDQGRERWSTKKKLGVGGGVVAGVWLASRLLSGGGDSNQTTAPTTTEGLAVVVQGSVQTAPSELAVTVPTAPPEKNFGPPVIPTTFETSTTIAVPPTTVFIPAPTLSTPDTLPATTTTIATLPPSQPVDTIAATLPPPVPVFVTTGLACFRIQSLKELNGGEGATATKLNSDTRMLRRFSGVTDLASTEGRVQVSPPVFAELVGFVVNLNGNTNIFPGNDRLLVTGCEPR